MLEKMDLSSIILEDVYQNNTCVTLPIGDWGVYAEFEYNRANASLLSLEDVLCLEVKDGGLVLNLSSQHSFFKEDNQIFHTKLSTSILKTGVNTCLFMWYGYRACLYVNDILVDEEWPLGILTDQALKLATGLSLKRYVFAPLLVMDAEEQTETLCSYAPFFCPAGENAGAGDCMPFKRNDRYCLYYLFDRRGHRSKGGLGAHQWAQISSADLRTWTVHPMAVSITDQLEGSICTGSLLQKGTLWYAFYAVRMSDESAAKLTWATSEDGVRFTKSSGAVMLTTPYEPVSARDPMVFQDEAGLYHMLVTTNLVTSNPFKAGGQRYQGCLAHLTSTDLDKWKQHDEPFYVPGYADQPECTDYFKWNGWYYLITSHHAIARYRLSRTPFGPWTKPRYDLLDALEVQVPKTAAFGNDRRLSTGFLARYPRTYAGDAVTHELFQRQDGTLGVQFVKEMLPSANYDCGAPMHFELNGAQGRAANTLGRVKNFQLQARLQPGSDTMYYGIELVSETEEVYCMRFDIAASIVSIQRPHQDMMLGEVRNEMTDIPLMGGLDIHLLVQGDILDIAMGDGRMMTMRLQHHGPFTVNVFAQFGVLNASSVVLKTQ